MTFTYRDNRQIKDEYKKLLIDNHQTMTGAAAACGLIPQQFNNRFNNKRLAFTDLKQWLDVLGYDMRITFVKRTPAAEDVRKEIA